MELHLNRILNLSIILFVPKKTPGEFKIIHDLSFPVGSSVNEHIPRENTTVQYESPID